MNLRTGNRLNLPMWAMLLPVLALLVNLFYIHARFQIAVDGIGTRLTGTQTLVSAVRPGSPAEKAGIAKGDILLQISNIKVDADNHLAVLENFQVGDQLVYVLQRNNQNFQSTLKLSSFWSQHPGFYFILYTIILIIILGSIYILSKKPSDQAVRLFFLYLQLYAISQNTRFLFLDEFYATFANIAFILCFQLFGVILLHFHLVFPHPGIRYSRFKPWLFFLYGISLLSGISSSAALVLRNYNPTPESGLIFTSLARWSVSWMGICLLLAFAAAIYQYVTIKDWLARKQLRLVIIGSAFGLLTPILFACNPEFIWKTEREFHLLSILEFPNATGSLLMISFLATAIFRYKIWDIEPFVRRAVLYILATILILFVYFAVLYFIEREAIRLTPSSQFMIMAVSILVFMLLRDKLQDIIDRIFFRKHYDTARVAAAFEEKLSGTYQTGLLKQQICHALDAILHFSHCYFFIRDPDGSFRLAYSMGKPDFLKLPDFTPNVELNQYIAKQAVFSSDSLTEKPALFSGIPGEIIVPVLEGTQASGILVLGPKRSEKSYTLQDINLLTLLSRRISSLFRTAELYKKDLDRQLLLERERTRIAEDMHDDVGASLTRISILSEIAKQDPDTSVHLNKLLNQISETSRDVTEEMNQIIWALNPKNDTLESFIAYIRRFIAEYLEKTSITYEFISSENYPDTGLSVEIRRNTYLVIREAVNNCVKHAAATNLTISIEFNTSGLHVSIRDNGKGFESHGTDKSGNGLKNMAKRIAEIQGELHINSDVEKGTEINFRIPIIENSSRPDSDISAHRYNG